ncbi:MAG: glycosyltransferase family 2 protein [Calditrichaeota bacterium]|nr:glycosyltransferase family 2 protein [Calditrichota bacterium]MCB0292254.1 glycosyltransferase family 2 protein [Calditrichota bacterium]
MNLSIVIPMFNEEDSVQPLYEAVLRAVEPLGECFEIILVDDGSGDATFARAQSLAADDSRLRIIRLSRNFGQTTALNAGFAEARGEIIVTLDGDLQNDPADIGAFIAQIRKGCDLVVGWRRQRQDDLVKRKLPSRMANWLVGKVTGVAVRDNGCALRAYRAEMIQKFPLYSEMHRLLPVITGLTGAEIAELPVNHFPRRYGRSKYGISRVYKVLFDLLALRMIFTLSRRAFFGFGSLAILFGLGGLGGFLLALLQWLLTPEAPVVISVGASILFASLAIFLLLQGFLCHLIYQNGGLRVEDLLTRRINRAIVKPDEVSIT